MLTHMGTHTRLHTPAHSYTHNTYVHTHNISHTHKYTTRITHTHTHAYQVCTTHTHAHSTYTHNTYTHTDMYPNTYTHSFSLLSHFLKVSYSPNSMTSIEGYTANPSNLATAPGVCLWSEAECTILKDQDQSTRKVSEINSFSHIADEPS